MENLELLPSEISMVSDYPNPFSPNTTISFNLRESKLTEVVIYSISGQKFVHCSLRLAPGNKLILWNGKDENNLAVSSGFISRELLLGYPLQSINCY